MNRRPDRASWLPNLWEDNLRRRTSGLAVAALLLASVVLPHVGRPGAPEGRSLLPAALFFLNANAPALGAADSLQLGLGVNLAYLGLGLQQFGLVLTAVSMWIVFGADEVNRWLWRILVVAAWLITLSVPLVLAGWLLLNSAGAAVELGLAWSAALAAGLLLLVLTGQSRSHRDFSWYVSKPELM
ncbi:MAG: hypothetical protein ACLGIF_00405 [Actinomycetes bacterium]